MGKTGCFPSTLTGRKHWCLSPMICSVRCLSLLTEVKYHWLQRLTQKLELSGMRLSLLRARTKESPPKLKSEKSCWQHPRILLTSSKSIAKQRGLGTTSTMTQTVCSVGNTSDGWRLKQILLPSQPSNRRTSTNCEPLYICSSLNSRKISKITNFMKSSTKKTASPGEKSSLNCFSMPSPIHIAKQTT